MTDYRTQIDALLAVVDSLPPGTRGRDLVEKAARTLHAEAFLDENRRVTGHEFSPRGRGVLRAFCSVCTWNRSLHGA